MSFDQSGKLVVKHTFEFAANGSVVQNPNYGVFQRFDQVRSAAFGVTPIIAAALVENLIAKLGP